MNYSLENHPRAYHLSFTEGLSFALTGSVYSERHWQLSQICDQKHVWGHRVVAVLEAMPIIGQLAALLERFVVFIFSHCFKKQPMPVANSTVLNGRVQPREPEEKPVQDVIKNPQVDVAKLEVIEDPSKPQAENVDIKIAKMWKNSIKAIEEHRKDPINIKTYISKDELPALDDSVNHQPLSSLSFLHSAAEKQGIRTRMEDAHFFEEINQGAITGVFDGHGGMEVAAYACEKFKIKFPEALLKANGDIHAAFIQAINDTQVEIAQHREWDNQGSTAVLCFIDKQFHKIYTATLGDSEANIYRKINGKLKSIPLSCVRDWTSKKDSQRRLAAIKKWPEALKSYQPLISNFPKELRFFSLNVSRALGDVGRAGTAETPAVVHKPKITIQQMQPGDVLILACDGLKDFADENEIVEQIQKESVKKLADQIVDFALDEAFSRDNVTVVAIQVRN